MGRFLCCSSHYWGIPIVAACYGMDGSWHTAFSSRSPSTEAFTFGLLWRTDKGIYSHRRKGFPSWSWAGWIGLIHWNRMYPPDHIQEGDKHANIRVVASDSLCVLRMVTESLDQAFDKANSQRITPWSILLIEAMVIQVKF